MTASLDLHALANEPGFGRASRVLQEHGHWDKHAVTDEKQKWTVHVTAMMPVAAYVTVDARTEEEAVELAEAKASKSSFSWSDYGDVDDVEGFVSE